MCGSRSGADLSRPRIVLDWNVSEMSASSERPVLSDLKACTENEFMISRDHAGRRATYSQNLEEISDFAVLGMDA